MGNLHVIGMGSLEDHKGFGALHPQFWRARTAAGKLIYKLNKNYRNMSLQRLQINRHLVLIVATQ